MDFLGISSLGASYQYFSKIEKKLKQQKVSESSGLQIQNSRSMENVALTHKTWDKEKKSNLNTTSPSHKKRRIT
jgi:hypothetical protein